MWPGSGVSEPPRGVRGALGRKFDYSDKLDDPAILPGSYRGLCAAGPKCKACPKMQEVKNKTADDRKLFGVQIGF